VPAPARAAGIALRTLAILALSSAPVAPQGIGAAAPPGRFGEANVERAHRALAGIEAAGRGSADYYFVLVGDIQNSVRSYGHDVFETIAGDVLRAADPGTGASIYDRIRFVLLLGDMVYEGSSARQRDNLERTFAGRGLDDKPYPNIARLLAEKAVIPAIGNHELLRFLPHTQTRYRDLFDSPAGVAGFKQFFAWDRFIADPHVLYPVPADLSRDAWDRVLAKTADPAARAILTSRYAAGTDGRYRLAFPWDARSDRAVVAAGQARLGAELAPIFRGAGYGTLPAVSSDNMIAYGVDAGDTIYLLLDSMSRGWQYPNFARLKQAIYPAAQDQHRLNLFSESPFNGQAAFYHAVEAYAREHGKSIVPMLHHSVINGGRNIYDPGIDYSHWLALGLPQTPAETGDATLMDEILFSDAPYLFSACVHAFETFSIVKTQAGQPDRTLRWTISGGGGGPLRRSFAPERLDEISQLYNRKLAAGSGAGAGRTIRITDDHTRAGFHYLIVHVVGGRIVDVTPHFLDERTIPKDVPSRSQLAVRVSAYTAPASVGTAVEFNPGVWGLEALKGALAFINWRPGISLGVVGDAGRPAAPGAGSRAFVVELSPASLDVYIPRSRLVTLRLPGFELWSGRTGAYRVFMTMGVEMPVLWNLLGTDRAITVGVKAFIPLGPPPAAGSGFARRTAFSFSVGYRLTR